MELSERREALKDWLRNLRELIAEERQIEFELERIETKMGPRTSCIGGFGGRGGDPMLDVASQHLAMQERYRKKLQEIAAARAVFEDMIDVLNPSARVLMRRRYIEGMSWKEIVTASNYSESRTHKIHALALDALLAKEAGYAATG